jgi:ABC-type dipeptide/oligopeptide/nickel transport system ATPase component
VDQILVVENGAIVESGSYDELTKKVSPVFSEFMKNSFEKKDEKTADEGEQESVKIDVNVEKSK